MIFIPAARRRIPFVEYIMQSIEDFQTSVGSIERSSEVEAILLCVQALSHSYDGAKTFSQKGFVSMAVGFLRVLPDAPTSGHLLIWRSLALTLQNFFEFAREDFLESAGEEAVHVLMRFLAQLSDWYRIDRENYVLGRVLRDFLRFLVLYMTDSTSREQLRDAYFHDPIKVKLVTGPCYHWILGEGDGDGTLKIDSAPAATSNLHNLGCDLEVASLDLLSNLVQDPAVTRAMAAQSEFIRVVRHIVRNLADDTALDREQTTATLRFLCFLTEQLTAIDIKRSAFVEELSIPTLARIFQSSGASSSVLEYTTRALWLLQVATGSSDDAEASARACLTWNDAQEIAAVMMNRSGLIVESPRLLCNVLGLTAEVLHLYSVGLVQAASEDGEMNPVARLLRKLLSSYRGHEISELVMLIPTIRPLLINGDPYTAFGWEDTAASSSPEHLALGVLHQFIRCFRYTSRDDLLLLLGENTPSRVDHAFQSEIFIPSIQLLHRFRDAHSEYSRMMSQDSLGMVKSVFRAFRTVEDAPGLQCRLHEYMQIAKQEQLLSASFSLLKDPDLESKKQVRCRQSLTVSFFD